MKNVLILLAVNLTSVAFVVGATYLALNNIEGWGWFVLGALMTYSFYSTSTKN